MLAYIRTFGCQLNVSDGEKIKSVLKNMGYDFTDNPEFADLIIFNTCAVRENAENRVFGHIGRAKYYKEKNKNLIIGLCGCMANEPSTVEKINAHYSCVDFIFGTDSISKLPQLLKESRHKFDENYLKEYCELGILSTDDDISQIHESTYKAFIPIMFGCNNFCSYCIVPYVRGRERSRSMQNILNEIQILVNSGYKEIMLLGQNVNSYEYDFPELLHKINDIPGDFWVRYMSSHPKDASEELIDVIADSPKICNHIHLPVQSGSNEILRRMNRGYTTEKYLQIIEYARKKIPDIAFTTDIIIGFPNESAEDFQKTLDLIRKVRYNNIYSFIYSRRSGTKAADFADSISHKEKTERMAELLRIQQEISIAENKAMLHKTLRVLAEENGYGRTESMVMVQINEKVPEGEFCNVEITGLKSIYLKGEIKWQI